MLLKELQVFFEQLAIHLSATSVEIYQALTVLQKKGIAAALCREIQMNMNEDLSFAQAWEKAVNAHCCMLSAHFKVDLIMFGRQFGFGSLDSQLKLCAKYEAACLQQITEKREYIKNNGKLSLTCSVLFGAFLYIVMM